MVFNLTLDTVDSCRGRVVGWWMVLVVLCGTLLCVCRCTMEKLVVHTVRCNVHGCNIHIIVTFVLSV